MRRHVLKPPHILKIRRHALRLIYLNEYLASYPGAAMTDKMGVTELNDILLKSMPKSWSKQAYGQGFDWESIYFKKAANTFEIMEISVSFYEGVMTPYY